MHYELAAKYLDLEGRRLVLRQMVSIQLILHEIRISNDGEPPWINSKIKKLIENENKA